MTGIMITHGVKFLNAGLVCYILLQKFGFQVFFENKDYNILFHAPTNILEKAISA